MGTIIRLADWFGIGDIVCSEATADCFNPKVVQATMGAILRVRVHYTDLGITQPRTPPPASPSTAPFSTARTLYRADLTPAGIVVMGNEGRGVRPATAAGITRRLYIPPFPADRAGSGVAQRGRHGRGRRLRRVPAPDALSPCAANMKSPLPEKVRQGRNRCVRKLPLPAGAPRRVRACMRRSFRLSVPPAARGPCGVRARGRRTADVLQRRRYYSEVPMHVRRFCSASLRRHHTAPNLSAPRMRLSSGDGYSAVCRAVRPAPVKGRIRPDRDIKKIRKDLDLADSAHWNRGGSAERERVMNLLSNILEIQFLIIMSKP